VLIKFGEFLRLFSSDHPSSRVAPKTWWSRYIGYYFNCFVECEKVSLTFTRRRSGGFQYTVLMKMMERKHRTKIYSHLGYCTVLSRKNWPTFQILQPPLPGHTHRPDDRGSKNLWNAGQLLRDNTTQYPTRRLSSSHSPPWDLEISRGQELTGRWKKPV
jgi:hypothetical protein